jgi:hypothetical protein
MLDDTRWVDDVGQSKGAARNIDAPLAVHGPVVWRRRLEILRGALQLHYVCLIYHHVPPAK